MKSSTTVAPRRSNSETAAVSGCRISWPSRESPGRQNSGGDRARPSRTIFIERSDHSVVVLSSVLKASQEKTRANFSGAPGT